jgi:hypothetical protein
MRNGIDSAVSIVEDGTSTSQQDIYATEIAQYFDSFEVLKITINAVSLLLMILYLCTSRSPNVMRVETR